MAEEGLAVAEGDAAGAAEASTTSAPMMDAGGVFSPTWMQGLPEELRTDKSLATFKDLPSLAKSFVTTKQMVGKAKVAIPSDTSGEGEWNEFWKAAGRPDTADDYGLKRPDEMPAEMFNEELAKSAQQVFHKIGLSKKQAEALLAFNTQSALSAHKQAQQAATDAQEEAKAALTSEWGHGKGYEAKLHLGNVAIEQGVAGNEDFRAKIVQKFGNDPDFIKFAANLGGKFAEHGVKVTQSAFTPAEIQDRINEAMSAPEYSNAGHPGHKAAVARVQRMFAEKHSGG